MTVDEVRARVARIQEMAGDDEAAHGEEDELHVDVLKAIAGGTTDDAAGIARAALATESIEFWRWYA